MPYGVGKRDACPVSRPWAVWKITDGGGEQIVNGGCHATRAEALAQQRALYARESASYTPGEEPAMREHMLVPVDWKAAASGDPGEIEGYFSVFGNVDQGGDIVVPGAFKKTLAEWTAPNRNPNAQPLPLIADHELSTEGVIGSVVAAREDGAGGWFRGRFSRTAKAQDIRQKMIEKHIRGVSFTYEAVKHQMGTVGGKAVRYLQELRLFEVTITPFPMNTLALASAKAAGTKPYGDVTYADPGYQDDGQHRYPLDTEAHCRAAWSYINMPKNQKPYTAEQLAAIKGRIRAALKRFGVTVSESSSLDFTLLRDALGKALEIPLLAARKAAADALLDEYLPGDESPGDEADGPADEPEPAAGAAADGTAGESPGDTAAAYALAIAKPSGPHDGAPGSEPPAGALAGPLAALEIEQAAREQDRLEAEILSVYGGNQ
jgi:HK97 family phage prohead protease